MIILNYLYNPITITIMMGISIIFALISIVYSFIKKRPSLKNLHRKKTIINTQIIHENETIDKSEKSEKEEKEIRDYYEKLVLDYSKSAIANQLKGGSLKSVNIQKMKGIRLSPRSNVELKTIHYNKPIKLRSVKTNKRFHVISENNGE